MKYDDFVNQVRDRANLGSRDEATTAIRATLQTLGERLYGGEANDLAAQLPAELAQYLRQGNAQEKFNLQEFFERVGRREGTDSTQAEQHCRAVIGVLEQAVSPGEIQDMVSQLPQDMKDFFTSLRQTRH